MTLLAVEGLGISFGGLKAVRNVSFMLKPGEIVSIIGPNGAGKTTLFNMISGVYTPGEGHVRLDGTRVTAPAQAVRAGQVLTIALDARVRVLRVLSFSERRGDATSASALFDEITEN